MEKLDESDLKNLDHSVDGQSDCIVIVFNCIVAHKQHTRP